MSNKKFFGSLTEKGIIPCSLESTGLSGTEVLMSRHQQRALPTSLWAHTALLGVNDTWLCHSCSGFVAPGYKLWPFLWLPTC